MIGPKATSKGGSNAAALKLPQADLADSLGAIGLRNVKALERDAKGSGNKLDADFWAGKDRGGEENAGGAAKAWSPRETKVMLGWDVIFCMEKMSGKHISVPPGILPQNPLKRFIFHTFIS